MFASQNKNAENIKRETTPARRWTGQNHYRGSSPGRRFDQLTAPNPRKDLRALGLLENQLLRGAEEDAPLVVLGFPSTGVLEVEVADEHQGHQGLPQAAARAASMYIEGGTDGAECSPVTLTQRSAEEECTRDIRETTAGSERKETTNRRDTFIIATLAKITELAWKCIVNCKHILGIPLKYSRVLDKR